jgi:hypothetical protein
MTTPNDTNEPSLASAGSVGEVLAKGIADIIRIAAEREWIPVTERLPDRNVNVLIYIPAADERTYIASLDEGGMWFSTDPAADAYSLGEDGAPTHWMPLPALPTDGK